MQFLAQYIINYSIICTYRVIAYKGLTYQVPLYIKPT